ncbi:unnamed protein product [Adineta ricciae]|uniref:G-protein coupled receptors family 1 profile domain-containing protein n=1 Tax=Adineta ricciae TaxID=249248 RepID=A0A815NM55_ADIRI|nr:unnamed protein product [Adineta ricciae]
MLEGENKLIGLALASITFGFAICATIISLIVSTTLIYNWYHARIKQDEKITIYLCIHIYLSIFISTSMTSAASIQTLLGDLLGQSFDSPWCIFSGYFALLQVSMMYVSFINQAFYRLVRIVYPQSQCFRSIKFYIVLTIVEYICTIGIQCVIIPWNGIIYLTNDYFCYVSFANIRALVWTAIFAYQVPCACTLMIYIRITMFLRNQANNLTVATRQRQRRDFLIVQRILIIMTLLITLGIPPMFFILRFAVTGDYHPLTLRVSCLPAAISMASLNIVLIFSIPQLKSVIRKLLTQNQVVAISIRVVTRMQVKIVKPDYFKPEHQDEFLRLRAQCRDLINKTRGFCDKAIPPLEYAIAQYSSSNPVNVKDLAEKVLSLVNPKDVLEQCEKVENAIITFNERLQLDEFYKKTEVKSFLCVVSGLALGITCLIGLFYAPACIVAEIAVASSDSSIMLLAIDLFCSGFDRRRVVHDFEQYKQSMNQAADYVTKLKKELSDCTQKHGRLDARLSMKDVHDLKPIYENLLTNMNTIRDLCLKPFPGI